MVVSIGMILAEPQQVRFTSSFLSFKPRVKTGTVTARAGASTFCTKMHPASLGKNGGGNQGKQLGPNGYQWESSFNLLIYNS
jgi:hypothetical protein